MAIIGERLKNIKRIIAVAGGKGGIGKSSIAAVLSLLLSKAGYKVGLLDLDFCGPSAHIILGAKNIFPKEEKGLVAPEIYGVKFMSIVYFAGDEPSPLRGEDISNALIELLTITRWGALDFLIIDMPPGIGDAALDVIRLIKRAEFLVIATPSKVTLETVRKNLEMLKELKIPVLGVIENMKMAKFSFVEEEMKRLGVSFLGEINFDESFEAATGNPDKILRTKFARDLNKIAIAGGRELFSVEIKNRR